MADDLPSEPFEDVAIIGMDGRFPGADSVEQLWTNLVQGVESITRFSPEELLAAGVDPDLVQNPNYVPVRGLIRNPEHFDAWFFGIQPREAELMDPQQRLFLEVCWNALERAGCDPFTYEGSIGVWGGKSTGMTNNTYLLNNLHSGPEILGPEDVLTAMLGNENDYLTTRVSHKLNLRGPSLNVQTACSTSLSAVFLAYQSLINYQCDIALAGGVSVSYPQKEGHLFQEGGIGSRDGHCHAFDAKAQGTVFSNGVGVVVLKRLQEAIADKDFIYAVIRGGAMNNDGASKMSFAAPSAAAQAEVIAMAQASAGVEPQTVGFIETHGTGTPIGDPIEVEGLTKAFRLKTEAIGFCALGAIKSNLGHLDSAAGVTGLIKAALVLHHKQIPPNANFEVPNPNLDLEKSPFFISDRLRDWKRGQAPLRAGVSAFGIGGTNVHLILEEAPPELPTPPSNEWHILSFSAKNRRSLDKLTANFADFLAQNQALNLADIAHTLHVGRASFQHRRILVAQNTSEAASRLRDLDAKSAFTGTAVSEAPEVVFMFPGGGTQYTNMGRELYDREPIYARTVDELLRLCDGSLGIRRLLFAGEETGGGHSGQLELPSRALPALFITEYALARLWQSRGVTPNKMIGHSMGEYTAACLAGVITPQEAIDLVTLRGRLFEKLPPGSMLGIPLPERDVADLLGDDLSIAAINAPSSCVVSGPDGALARLEQLLSARGIEVPRLHISVAAHSKMLEPILAEFREFTRTLQFKAPSIPYVSNLTGTWIKPEEAVSPEYWVQHLRHTVRFADGLSAIFNSSVHQVLLEVGPGQALSTFAKQHPAKARDQVIVQSLRHPKDNTSDLMVFYRNLGALWTGGVKLDWTALPKGRRLPLPTYPFEKKAYYIEPMKRTPQAVLPAPGSELQPHVGAAAATPIEPIASSQPGIATLPTQAKTSRKVRILSKLKTIIHEMSGMEVEDIESGSNFLALGFDSLFLTQVSLKFQKEFKIKITFRQLFDEAPSPDSLADFIDQKLPAEAFAEEPVAVQVTGPAPTAPPTAGTNGLGSPTPVHVPFAGTSAIEQTIQRQLELMAQQLEILRGAGTSATLSVASLPQPASPAPKETPTVVAGNNQNPRPPVPDNEAREAKPASFGPYKPLDRGGGKGLDAAVQANLNDFIRRYQERTQGSKQLTQSQREFFADARAVTGFRQEYKEIIYQIATQKSAGCRVWDVDGNEYIDLTSGFGINLFGYQVPEVIGGIRQQLDRGIELGMLCPLAKETAQLIRQITGMERCSFTNTGSEAVSAAIRAARTATGRDLIAVFDDEYHGIADELVVRSTLVKGNRRPFPASPGIPKNMVDKVLILSYNDPKCLETLREHADELAAVIIEPVQNRHPDFDPSHLFRPIRDLTEEHGIAMIFDEMITGFRLHRRGAQGFFNINVDICCYGKIMSGGLPIAAVAGKARFLDAFDGGMWQYGDDSFPSAGFMFFGGTFTRHPLSLASAHSALLKIKNSGDELWQELNSKSDRFAERINDILDGYAFPAKLEHRGSIFNLKFTNENPLSRLIQFYLRHKGIHVWERPFFIQTAHSEADLDAVVCAWHESVKEMVAAGYLPECKSGVSLTSRGEILVPMTESQSEIWLGCQMGDDSLRSYNEIVRMDFKGDLNLQAMRQAIKGLVQRHESLRANPTSDGLAFRILPRIEVDISFHDLSSQPPHEKNARFADIELGIDQKPFELLNEPLIRFTLVKRDNHDFSLITAVHHLICDGWSFGIALKDLGRLYSSACTGQDSGLPVPLQLREYNALQKSYENSEDAKAVEAYWLGQFNSPPPQLDLPADFRRPAVKSYRGSRIALVIDQETGKALKKFSGNCGCTLFVTLLGGFNVLMNRLSGETDLVVGIPMAGQALLENGELVAHCVNFIPLRSTLDLGQPISKYLAELRSTTLDAGENQNYTYKTLLKTLKLARDASRKPLVSVSFTVDPALSGIHFHGLTETYMPSPRLFAKFDLHMNVIDNEGELIVECDFITDLFKEETIRRWMNHYRIILQSMLKTPDARTGGLPLLTAAESALLLERFNDTKRDYPNETPVHRLVVEQASSNPDAIAVVFDAERLTYGELDRRSDLLAGSLREQGVVPGELVGVFLERSADMVIALLAVWKAGGAYVPMDPAFPADRLCMMIEDASMRVILTQSSLASTLPPHHAQLICLDQPKLQSSSSASSGSALRPPPSDNLAYVIFTSGSTGRPKGVEITHRALANFLHSMRQEPGFTKEDVLLAVTTLSFDIAGLELWLPLTTGAKVVIASKETAMDGQTLMAELGHHGVTVMQATPITWRILLEAGWPGSQRLKALCGGEALQPDLAEALLPRCAALWNMYGPTETTIWSTCQQMKQGEPITIGRPIANTQVYVVNPQWQLQPFGVPGELLIGGEGLARGYLSRPELTAEKFIPNPFRAGKLYRTGDLARWHADGTLEHLGRTDHQVKLRGYRIELGEIETALSEVEGIRQAVVVLRDEQLVAYYVSASGQQIDVAACRNALRSRLPEYMVPSLFVHVEEFPLTPNGKVDRRALPAPDEGQRTTLVQYEAPRNGLEKQLAQIWEIILDRSSIGIHDNFFDLGGHSLLAVRIFAEIEKATGQRLPLASLFGAPTISLLARELEDSHPDRRNWSPLVVIQPHGVKPPLFCVHGAGGNVLLYRDLAARLGADQPVYGFQSYGLDGHARPLETIEQMAEAYVDELKIVQPQGPYCLAGYCLGGVVAYQMARLLRQMGDEVAFVGMLDTYNPAESGEVSRISLVVQRAGFHARNLLRAGPRHIAGYMREKLRVARDGELAHLIGSGAKNGKLEISDRDIINEDPGSVSAVQEINDLAVARFQPQPYDGAIVIYKPQVNYSFMPDPQMGWRGLARGGVLIVELPVNPHAMLVEPFVKHLAEDLAERLRAVTNPSQLLDPVSA